MDRTAAMRTETGTTRGRTLRGYSAGALVGFLKYGRKNI